MRIRGMCRNLVFLTTGLSLTKYIRIDGRYRILKVLRAVHAGGMGGFRLLVCIASSYGPSEETELIVLNVFV